MRAHDVALSTFKCTSDAKEPNNIAIVGVEVLSSCCTVDANAIALAEILAYIFDVAKDMSESVLRDKVAEVGSKAHISHCRLVKAPCLDRKAFEEDEAFAIEELVSDSAKEGVDS
jgi:hypothetical protein